MDLRSDAFLAGGPDASSVILNDLAYNGQSDPAAALRRVSWGICTVKTVKYVGKILCRNAFSIVLNLNLDKVSHILDPDIDDSFFLVQIFDGIADNVIDHTLHLLCICNDHHILIRIIEISQLNAPCFHIQTHLFQTVLKILGYIDLCKGIRNLICVNLGVKGQLIDQSVHIIGFIINRADISVQLLRWGSNPVQNPFHITLDGRDRRLKVMRNIADQFLAFLVILKLFFCIFL